VPKGKRESDSSGTGGGATLPGRPGTFPQINLGIVLPSSKFGVSLPGSAGPKIRAGEGSSLRRRGTWNRLTFREPIVPRTGGVQCIPAQGLDQRRTTAAEICRLSCGRFNLKVSFSPLASAVGHWPALTSFRSRDCRLNDNKERFGIATSI
jgi:hypothetical protein